MGRFECSVALVADEALVWSRVMDVEKMPLYWPSVSSVRVTRTEAQLTYAEVSFARGGTGSVVITANDAERMLLLYYASGPMRGTQRVAVRRGVLKVVWDVRFEGFVESMRATGRLKIETKEALERIAGLQDAWA